MPNSSSDDCSLCGHSNDGHFITDLEYELDAEGEKVAATCNLNCGICGCVGPVRIEKHRVDPTLN